LEAVVAQPTAQHQLRAVREAVQVALALVRRPTEQEPQKVEMQTVPLTKARAEGVLLVRVLAILGAILAVEVLVLPIQSLALL